MGVADVEVPEASENLSHPGCEKEAARIASLHGYQILDTESEPAFDRITQSAASIFSVPTAFVSFVDESRQWMKSTHGSDLEETPREIAFCAHTVAQQDVFVILDAKADCRFDSNPLVYGTHGFRFYAGAPILTENGHSIGSVCIVDTKPRHEFTRKDGAMLQTLAEFALHLLNSHKQASALKASETETANRYALVARATLDGVWDWDIKRDCVYYSPRWQYILGEPEVPQSLPLSHWLDRVHPDDRGAVDRDIEDHLKGITTRFRSEHRVRHGDGSWRWVVVRGLAQRTKTRSCVRMAGSLMDITREKTSDPLTGLPNRILLQERLAHLIQRAQLEQKWNFAVLFVDVDHFKHINDRFGHLMGDEALRCIAERLQKCVSSPPFSAESMVARFAGDEFVVLLDGLAEELHAEQIAAQFQVVLRPPIRYNGEEIAVEVSIGIAYATHELLTPEHFLQRSDLAMYKAKTHGRGVAVTFTNAIMTESLARLELEAGLREAVGKNQLRVMYQPQVDLRTGQLIGCEALVRWHHPKKGLLAPDAFIQVAEEIGVIAEIDACVLKQACRQLQIWRTQMRQLRMSVNISGQHLERKGFSELVLATLSQHNLPTDALCLELTETVLMRNMRVGIELMHELKAEGLGLHMDDFGSGYSSFRQLADLPFDTLKIDRSFIAGITTDSQARTIAGAIIGVAHALGLKVIAEGIESKDQAESLSTMTCEFGQGYYFDKPLTPQDFGDKYLDLK